MRARSCSCASVSLLRKLAALLGGSLEAVARVEHVQRVGHVVRDVAQQRAHLVVHHARRVRPQGEHGHGATAARERQARQASYAVGRRALVPRTQ